MTSLAAKRMAKERQILESSSGDYFVHFENDNLLAFDAYVIGPTDTPYHYKLAHLRFEIPDRYPLVPPKVKFIQHTGPRIHPNLYVEGKVCLSILGTWPGEPWAFGMTCNTVLITVRSLLDDKPYKHEPGDRDDPAFTNFVEYASWRSMLIDYLGRARPGTPAKTFIAQHICDSAEGMRAALARQALKNGALRHFASPYTRGRNTADMLPRYPALQTDLEKAIKEARAIVGSVVQQQPPPPPPPPLVAKRSLSADGETEGSGGQKAADKGSASPRKRAKASNGPAVPAVEQTSAPSGVTREGSSQVPAKKAAEVIDLT